MTLPQAPHLGSLHFSTDIAIIMVLVLVSLYGLMMGHGKLRTLALSTYVGLVLASELSAQLHHAVPSLSELTVRLTLYISPIVLLEFSRRHHEPGSHRGLIITLVLAVATTALVVSGYMTQLGAAGAKHLAGSSSIAYVIYQWRLVWIAVVPGLIAVEAFIGGLRDQRRH